MGVFEKITATRGQKGTQKWMIGEQLMEILRREPDLIPLVEEDLETLNLDGCEKAMKAKADEMHKTVKGNCVCITPDVAESVIRKYFGLPEAGEDVQAAEPAPAPATSDPVEAFLELEAFF